MFYCKKKAKEFEGIKIIRYEASIYYANVENFVYKINKLTEIKPSEVLAKLKKKDADYQKKLKELKRKQV
jgi:hypothetical protein